MEKLLKRVPIPIGCISLGFAGLGLLLRNLEKTLLLCGVVSCCCLLLLLAKLIYIPSSRCKLSSDPIGLSLMYAGCMRCPGCSTTMLVLEVYYKKLHYF